MQFMHAVTALAVIEIGNDNQKFHQTNVLNETIHFQYHKL
jgi:hypothetical protein